MEYEVGNCCSSETILIIGNNMSMCEEYGVPQGSGLGPLLFSIYINDLKNLGLNGQLFMFADDVSIFYPYKFDQVLKVNIERDAALLFEFARLNRLVINPTKTKLIRFRPHASSMNDYFSVSIDGRVICETNLVKYLGITVQNNMSWDVHINDLKRKLASALGILYKFKYKLSADSKLLIYNSLIQSHLNYIAIVYAYNRNMLLKSLQSMQNKALKTIFKLPITFSTVSLYRDIAKTILPIYGLHEYKVLLFVGHRVITFSQIQQHVNTRNGMNLRVPRCRLEDH